MGGKERWMRRAVARATVAEWQLLSLRSSSLREGAERAHRIAKAGYSLFLEKPPRETRRQGGLCSLARQSVARGLSPSSGRETDSLRTKPERRFPPGCGEHEAPGSDEGGTRAAPPSIRPSVRPLLSLLRTRGVRETTEPQSPGPWPLKTRRILRRTVADESGPRARAPRCPGPWSCTRPGPPAPALSGDARRASSKHPGLHPTRGRAH